VSAQVIGEIGRIADPRVGHPKAGADSAPGEPSIGPTRQTRWVQPSPIRYATAGDVHIAYRTLGDGPLDLVFISGAISNLELDWDEPGYVSFMERLASAARVITFDRRGVGISDRVASPSLEDRMDDVRAVLDDVGSRSAVLFGFLDGGAMATLFTATYPNRARGLVLYAFEPRRRWAPDYPWGLTPDAARRYLEDAIGGWNDIERHGNEELAITAPSHAADENLIRWLVRWRRLSTSPGAFADFRRMNLDVDVRHILPAIRVPVLVMHRPDQKVANGEVSRYVAQQIPTATYVELPGRDLWPFLEGSGEMTDAVVGFLRETANAAPEEESQRVLVTILFTDIAGATERAARLGDVGWREVLAKHHRVVRQQLARFRGREVDTAGDGFFASFDGPARGIRCAAAINEQVRSLGLQVRAGLHTGECEVVDGKVAGIAVHIGARVAARAAPGEVLVSSTVKDLVAGSGLRFEDRGEHELKGVPGEWHLYALDSSSDETLA
jgi:class 3 adenylate cyclase/pimeloyl-ACP methyl ester carboxylesterase